MKSVVNNIRYFPDQPEGSGLGIDMIDIGKQSVAGGVPYPPRGHPSGYEFSWHAGRILGEHQLLYLTEGEGEFETLGGRRWRLKAGDLVLLREGVWHRYRPDAGIGWTEFWIGFRGHRADEWLAHFLPEADPVVSVGLEPQMLSCFETALAWMHRDAPGHRQVATSKILEILALLRAHRLAASGPRNRLEAKIQRARLILLERLDEALSMPEIARELGLGYSLFRQTFKRDTGYAPGEFLGKIRINRAKDLLIKSDASVSEIAVQTGFSSVFYFSKFFKKEVGRSPGEYRARILKGEGIE